MAVWNPGVTKLSHTHKRTGWVEPSPYRRVYDFFKTVQNEKMLLFDDPGMDFRYGVVIKAGEVQIRGGASVFRTGGISIRVVQAAVGLYVNQGFTGN